MKRFFSILLVLMIVLGLLVPAVALAEEMLLPDIAAFAGDKLTVGEMTDYEYCIQQTYTGSAENIQAVADAYIRLLKEKYDLLNTFSYTANVDNAYPRYDLAFIAKTAPDGFEVFTMNDSTYGYSANDCHLFICYTQLAGSNENFLQITYSSSFTYADTGDRLRGNSVSTDAPKPVVEATAEPTAEPTPEPTPAVDVPQGYHTFNDPVVEAAVRKELNKEEGDISYTDLLGITNLFITKEITSYKDFSHFHNLQSLTLNQCTDATPLADMTSLTYLCLYYCEINDCSPLANLKNLTKLSIRVGANTDLSPLRHLPELTELSLKIDENFDFLQLSYFDGLKSLSLASATDDTNIQNNDIAALAGLTNLTELYITFEEISDVTPLAGLTNLTALSLWNNKIKDISPLAGLSKLTWLNLAGNAITDISPLKEMTNMEQLFLYENEICDISPLSDMTKLTLLNISQNCITDFSPIEHISIEKLVMDAPMPTATPKPTAPPTNYRAPIAGNEGLLVMSPEEYNNDIYPCDTIGQQDNYYQYRYFNCGKEYSGDGNDTEWAKFEEYVDALEDSGYYQIVANYDGEVGNTESWYLKYIGPESVKRIFKVNSDHTEKAAIVVQSFHGDVYIFYSLDVITNDLEDTQYRLNKYINVDNPRPTGGSGGGGGTPIADHTEERCSICGGSGKRTCSSCYGSGDIDCGGCYGNEPCSQCGGDGRRDCPNINCSNGMVDCTTCGGDGKK